ncbi:hypothetical protein [Bdellovibrio sp. HCB209]|uniref:hypothetical protein n=1 Tax=Bdellovibrio sp. HCB209 TaxID=3394354 RepID=UPI0039B433BF
MKSQTTAAARLLKTAGRWMPTRSRPPSAHDARTAKGGDGEPGWRVDEAVGSQRTAVLSSRADGAMIIEQDPVQEFQEWNPQ